MGTRIHDKPEDWRALVGMPDESDKRNITNLINIFKDTVFPVYDTKMTGRQWINYEVRQSKQANQLDGEVSQSSRGDGMKIKETDMRIGTAMPNLLWHEISEAYPAMFRDKDMTYWFIKNFPEFRVTNR